MSLYFSVQNRNICADDFEAFIAQWLIHFPKGVILVIDRWMVHRSGMRRLKDRFGRRVEVEWLPAYAPELNPVEQIWNYGKYSQLANFIPDDINHLASVLDVSLSQQAKKKNCFVRFFIVQR